MLSDVDVLIEFVICANMAQKLDVQAVQIRTVIRSPACRQAVITYEVTVTQSNCQDKIYALSAFKQSLPNSKSIIPNFFSPPNFTLFHTISRNPKELFFRVILTPVYFPTNNIPLEYSR
jgi:hypothetical protein